MWSEFLLLCKATYATQDINGYFLFTIPPSAIRAKKSRVVHTQSTHEDDELLSPSEATAPPPVVANNSKLIYFRRCTSIRSDILRDSCSLVSYYPVIEHVALSQSKRAHTLISHAGRCDNYMSQEMNVFLCTR